MVSKSHFFFLTILLGILPFNAFAQGKPLAPFAEYHAHLLSPVTSKMTAEPPLAEIEVPQELARLLRAREQAWNDKAGLAKLYTRKSVVLNLDNEDLPTWVIGADAIAAEMSTRFARPIRITPVAYDIQGSAGYIAGYFTRGEAEGIKYVGHVFLSLMKGPDGVWQIAGETPTFPGPSVRPPITAEDLIQQLDEAGIQKGVVLSLAYWFGSAWSKPVENEYEKVKAENDWVAREVSRFPQRLVAFCSFNPLKEYALEELNRCSRNPAFKGVKLHFGNSGVQIAKNAEHVQKLKQIFQAANERKLAIIAHLWTGPEYEESGRSDAEVFLNQILPSAPDITVQVAHMAGGGRSTDAALAVFAEAIAAKDARTKNLFFDVATLTAGQTAEGLQKDAQRMRQIGLDRILYGTDTAPPNPVARQSWGTFRALIPLTDAEIKTIAGNVAPYLR